MGRPRLGWLNLGLGFRVLGSGFRSLRVVGFGCWVQGIPEFRNSKSPQVTGLTTSPELNGAVGQVLPLGARSEGSGFRVCGLGFRV